MFGVVYTVQLNYVISEYTASLYHVELLVDLHMQLRNTRSSLIPTFDFPPASEMSAKREDSIRC